MISTALEANVRQAFLLPDFLSDVRVNVGPVPHSLGACDAGGVLWQAACRNFLLRVPGVARFLVEGGHSVTIEIEGGDEEIISRHLGMSPLAALLYQQGRLAFHAAAAADSRSAVLLAGVSGSGKSTLLAALLQRGWRMLCDELTPLIHTGGSWCACPTGPEVHLWREAAEKLNWTLRSKVSCAVAPLPVRAIFWLSAHNFQTIEFSSFENLDRFRSIGAISYNTHIAAALLDYRNYLHDAGSIARSIPVHSLRRPLGQWTVEELVRRVELE